MLFATAHFDRVCRRLHGTVILCYHGVVERAEAAWADDSIPVQRLESQIAWLRRIGPILPLHEVLAEPNGRGVRFALVFDDATVSVVRHAAPLMAGLQVPWTIAVPTALVPTGEPNWLLHFLLVLQRTRVPQLAIPWDPGSAPEIVPLPVGRDAAGDRFRKLHFSAESFDSRRVLRSILEQLPANDPALALPEDLQTSDLNGLRTCAEAGATFVSHGAHHVPLDVIGDDAVLAEWVESRDWLSAHLGTIADTSVFVAPYGHRLPRHGRGLRDAGCRFLVTGLPGVVSSGFDPFQVPRLPGFSRSIPGLAARIARMARRNGTLEGRTVVRGVS